MKEMTLEERKANIQTVADEVAQRRLTLGSAVKRLRENVLGGKSRALRHGLQNFETGSIAARGR